MAGFAARAEARPASPPLPADLWNLEAVADTDSVAADTSRAARGRPPVVDSLVGDTAGLPPDTLDQDVSGFPSPDDLFDQLKAMGGFRTIEYRGREVRLDVVEEVVRLNDEAAANYAGSALEADTVVYRAQLQFIEARGDISLAGEGQNITSNTTLYYDVSGLKGTVLDARTSFAEQGAEWYVRGDATLRGDERAFVEAGSFTSCELDQPHYYFKAGQIKVVRENLIVAWPVTLYINDVPVAWLPFFAQDIRRGRRSGFLPPRFGVSDIVSTSDNVRRQVSDFGYYWAISDFLDAQATVDWFSGAYTRVNGAFRYRFLKNFIQGRARASYSFGDNRTFDLYLDHTQELSPVTDFKIDAQFIQNTRIFEEQSFNPNEQTQTISSNVGFNHRFPFASMNVSARRQQSLGAQRGNLDLELPRVDLTFSPVTLFRAPRNRAGAFNNMTLSGRTSFRRSEARRDSADNRTTTMGSSNLQLGIGAVSLGGSGSVTADQTSPFDTLVTPFTRTTVNYSGSANYQINLMGSTTLRPTASVTGAAFRSPDTNDELISVPARLNVGATLSTDVYGFFPGFGPFARVRHKVSPRFSWNLAPATSIADSLRQITGFPANASISQNMLSLTINQTFEAKVREDVQLEEEERALLEGRDLDSLRAANDSAQLAEAEAGDAAAPADIDLTTTDPADSAGIARPPDPAAVGLRGDSALVDSLAAGPGVPGTRSPARRQPQRNVVLLAINSGPLNFDFSGERQGGSALVTDRWRHGVNSDLLRGLNLNITFDLFEGAGEEREFRPILAEMSGGFTFSSARGLGGIFGLGQGGGRSVDPGNRVRDAVDSRHRLDDFDRSPEVLDGGATGGPWTLGLNYSLQRSREAESATDRQSLGLNLALQPTPNLRLRWSTSYNITDKEFTQHTVTLDRDLHRWIASFAFVRAPNGNLLFQVSVRLRDAPDLKVDYDQQSLSR